MVVRDTRAVMSLVESDCRSCTRYCSKRPEVLRDGNHYGCITEGKEDGASALLNKARRSIARSLSVCCCPSMQNPMKIHIAFKLLSLLFSDILLLNIGN
jgi:hypothetical protein